MNSNLNLNFVNKSALQESLGVSARTLENMVREQQFPAGVRIGKSLYWKPEVIQLWLEGKFAKQLRTVESGVRKSSANSLLVKRGAA